MTKEKIILTLREKTKGPRKPVRSSVLAEIDSAELPEAFVTEGEMTKAISKIPTADVTKKYVDDHLAEKQDTLTAGANITIDEDNTISASGGGASTFKDVCTLISTMDPSTYGDGTILQPHKFPMGVYYYDEGKRTYTTGSTSVYLDVGSMLFVTDPNPSDTTWGRKAVIIFMAGQSTYPGFTIVTFTKTGGGGNTEATEMRLGCVESVNSQSKITPLSASSLRLYTSYYFPVGTVITRTTQDIINIPGQGWSRIGSQTIGEKTVYYYERTF